MKQLSKYLLVLVCGVGFSIAQTKTGQQPQTAPPYSSQQGMPQVPQGSPQGQAAPAATSPIGKAESDIQAALHSQMPATADKIVVSTTSDNKIRLDGIVDTDKEKKQAMQIARSVAPEQTIVNKLSVATPTSGPNTAPQGSDMPGGRPGSQPPAGQSPRQPIPPTMPPMGVV
jgi:hypothetical protein